jgi:hypothetical protein
MENTKEKPTYRLEPEHLMKGDRILIMDLQNVQEEVTVKQVNYGPGFHAIECIRDNERLCVVPEERYITAFMSKYQARKRKR